MTTRMVRDKQHGTTTGYSYGCRCQPCRDAHRIYDQGRERVPSQELIEKVIAAIDRESDLDGVCTATLERLSELAGFSERSVQGCIHFLGEQNRLSITGMVGRGGVLEIHLDGAA